MIRSRRWVRTGAVVSAAVVWTLGAAYLVALGRFVAADTRCGHVEPRVNMAGGWIVIVTVTVWTAPFVVLAVVHRRRWLTALTALSVLVAVLVVADMFVHPVAFCW